ncbi:MAG: hypothetical protein H0W02_22585 [Ktedonobacteraceae bacterium]|nr:hypothetical protein [Ktedonobacteraceae bacterium]
MFNFVCSLAKRRYLLSLLALVLLCGCSSQVSQTPTATTQPVSQTPTATAQPVSHAPTATPQPVSHQPTAAPQPAFTSYAGKWQVHGSLLSINANHTGLEQWNVGPCSQSATNVQMCNGNAKITFIENATGSIKGTIQSVSYSQWNGGPAPTGFHPDSADPRAGDTFQLQHSGVHLLYTTWFGAKVSLNNNNRYWCDAYALKSGWKQCGA